MENEKPSRSAIKDAAVRFFEHGRLVFCGHLFRRSDGRGIPQSALLRVFATAEVVSGPTWDEDYGNWKITIAGETLDDDEPVSIALAVDLRNEMLYLITAY